jgi:hypothetical protein
MLARLSWTAYSSVAVVDARAAVVAAASSSGSVTHSPSAERRRHREIATLAPRPDIADWIGRSRRRAFGMPLRADLPPAAAIVEHHGEIRSGTAAPPRRCRQEEAAVADHLTMRRPGRPIV